MSAGNEDKVVTVETTSEMLGGKPESGATNASIGGEATAFQPVNYDYSKLDYVAYDRLFHGRLPNFEIGGLFVKPVIEHIANFMIGRGVAISVEEPKTEESDGDGGTLLRPSYTNQVLERWSLQNSNVFRGFVIETLKFGDFYTVVEDDGTITAIPPSNVNKVIDPISRKVLRFEIYSEVEEIAANNRRVAYIYRDVRTIKERVIEKRLKSAPDRPNSWSKAKVITIDELGEEVVLPNPMPNAIGRFDIVHWHNNRSASDMFGYSEVYGMITALRRYDDLLNWAITGNKLMGRPSPVFQGIKNVQSFLELFGRPVTDREGNQRRVIDWKAEQVQVLGEGAEFKLVSPQPFASDTKTLVEILFWIISQHSGVPEFVWGTAVQGSRASVGEQMPPFAKFIEGKRKQYEGLPLDEMLGSKATGGFHELTDIWLRKRKLVDGKISIDVATVVSWPDMTDREAELTRRIVEYLYSQGLFTKATTLRTMNTIIGNPVNDLEEELRLAQEEFKTRVVAEDNTIVGGQVNAPNGTEADGSPAPGPTTADGSASGVENDGAGDNQFTGRS